MVSEVLLDVEASRVRRGHLRAGVLGCGQARGDDPRLLGLLLAASLAPREDDPYGDARIDAELNFAQVTHLASRNAHLPELPFFLAPHDVRAALDAHDEGNLVATKRPEKTRARESPVHEKQRLWPVHKTADEPAKRRFNSISAPRILSLDKARPRHRQRSAVMRRRQNQRLQRATKVRPVERQLEAAAAGRTALTKEISPQRNQVQLTRQGAIYGLDAVLDARLARQMPTDDRNAKTPRIQKAANHTLKAIGALRVPFFTQN